MVAGAVLSASAVAAPPYTFAPGGQIRASELNANFQALESRIDALGAPTPSNLLMFSATCSSFGGGATVTFFTKSTQGSPGLQAGEELGYPQR